MKRWSTRKVYLKQNSIGPNKKKSLESKELYMDVLEAKKFFEKISKKIVFETFVFEPFVNEFEKYLCKSEKIYDKMEI
jgi:hypothetical protein